MSVQICVKLFSLAVDKRTKNNLYIYICIESLFLSSLTLLSTGYQLTLVFQRNDFYRSKQPSIELTCIRWGGGSGSLSRFPNPLGRGELKIEVSLMMLRDVDCKTVVFFANAGDRQYANARRSGASVKTARENEERR